MSKKDKKQENQKVPFSKNYKAHFLLVFILILVGGLFVDEKVYYYMVGGFLGISIGTIYGFVLKVVSGTSSEE